MKISDHISSLARMRDESAVIVYTMGKVGSTSLESQLPVGFHTHTLFGRPPCLPYHLHKYGRLGVLLRRLLVYPWKRWVLRSRRHIKIVTFYRDPLDRNPSMFMQDLPFWLSAYTGGPEVSTRDEDPLLLVSAYKHVFPHDYPMQWVKDELARFTGITSADLALGRANHRVLHKGKYSVFIGRTEALAQCLPALSDYLGIPELSAKYGSNRGSRKWYAPIYAEFLEALKTDEQIAYSPAFRSANGFDDARP